MPSLDSTEDIFCVKCKVVLSKDCWVHTATSVDGIHLVWCSSCPQTNYCCFVCVQSFPHPNNLKWHTARGGHKQMMKLQPQPEMSKSSVNASEGDVDGEDLNFPFDGSGAGKFTTLGGQQVDEAEAEPAVKTGNWLSDVPSQLGSSAVTLDSILDGGSFPKKSKSPAHCHFELQHPGQGAKHLTAKPLDLLPPGNVADEEALFHVKMTSFLNSLTKHQQDECAHLLLQVCNAQSMDGLSIFHKTCPPISTGDFRDFHLSGRKSIASNLSIPMVLRTPDLGHSCTTLTNVTQHMLASAVEVDQFSFEANVHPSDDFFNGNEPATINTTQAEVQFACGAEQR